MSCQVGRRVAAHMLKRQTADKKAHGETDSAESGHPEQMLQVLFLRELRYTQLYWRSYSRKVLLLKKRLFIGNA